MKDDAVLFERDDGIGIITLNRPHNRNSMTPELLDGFVSAVQAARSDAGVRCVVVTGTGTCFSAGADFRSQIQRDGRPGVQPHERSFAMYQPFLSVLDIEVPVVAAMNGHAIGGGFGLSLACDIRIGNTESKYGANFVRLGLSSGMAISYLLPRIVGPSRAAELMFTGRLFKGDEAVALGVLSQAHAPEEVRPRAMEVARSIAANAPVAVRLTKQALYRGLGWNVRDGALAEAYAQAATITTSDVQEGIRALLDKREPKFRGQ